MKDKIELLIVENDESFRLTLKLLLEEKDFIVSEAENGRVAREMISLRNYDLILSDVQMPYLNGIELLEWVRQSKRTSQFILMTGFSNLIETHKAFQLGANDFLSKPFSESELINSIIDCLNLHEQPIESIAKEVEYCKIPIEDFLSATSLKFDVYLKLTDTKYLKVLKKNEEQFKARIESYRQKGLSHLYLTKEEFKNFIELTLKISKALEQNKKFSNQKRLSFAKYTGEVIMERAFVLGTDKDSFLNATEFVKTNLEVFTNSELIVDVLETLNKHGDFLYAHSLGVCIYSAMIAEVLGWNSIPTMTKITTAGLFHDIGLKELPREIINKPRARLTNEELALLTTHPKRSKDIMESLQIMTSDIAQIVYEHHEDCIGTGYPRGIRRINIHPLARLLSVADVFCDYTIKNPNFPLMTAKEAIAHIKTSHAELLDQDMIKALCKLVKL